jgi:hypothetical protein
MLKSKKTFSLLMLVVFIWGIIGYKVYSQLTDTVMIASEPLQIKKYIGNSTDSMHLVFSYPDPFLKNVNVKRTEPKHIVRVSSVQARQTPSVTKATFVIDWSQVKYFGVMSNASRAVKTGIVHFDNNDFFVREGDKIDVFSVLDVRADSIKLGCGNSTQYIRKQKSD